MTQPVLKTARLTLRPLQDSDADFCVAALNKKSVWEWLSVIPNPYTHDDALFFINELAKDSNWLIEYDGQPAGVIGINDDLGYWLDDGCWGKGIITEASQAVIDYAFTTLGWSEVMSGHFDDNDRSRNALEKLGFTDAGPQVLGCVADGRTEIPSRKMRLTHGAWLEQRSMTI